MMISSNLRISLPVILVGLLGAGCAVSPSEETSESSEADLVSGRVGAVYTLSNEAASNDVIVYRRGADGVLQYAATHATTGKGSGDGLGSQGALTLSSDRQWLFAVSAGSNELSVFRVHGSLSISSTRCLREVSGPSA